MQKIILFMLTCIWLHAGAYNLKKECPTVNFTNIEYKLHKTYRGDDVYGFQYGLKNTSDKPVKWTIHIDMLDTDGHVADEKEFSGSLKPYREKGFSKDTYYPIGEDLSTFSGDINITLSCEAEQAPQKPGITQNDKIVLHASKFKMFEGKSRFEASVQAGLILRAVDANGGFEKFFEKIKPCMGK